MSGIKTSVSVKLSWPDKALNPNSRAHRMAVWRVKKDAKFEAGWSTRASLGLDTFDPGEGRIPVHYTATPPIARDRDDDNLIASCKGQQDAIAKALGVNDNLFIAPTIEWLPPVAPGSLTITVGPRTLADAKRLGVAK